MLVQKGYYAFENGDILWVNDIGYAPKYRDQTKYVIVIKCGVTYVWPYQEFEDMIRTGKIYHINMITG